MSKKWTTEMFVDYLKDNHDNYILIGEYTSSKDKVTLRHKDCGRDFSIIVNNFKKRGNCPLCSKNRPKNTEVFKQEVYELVGDEYKVLGTYKTCKDKIEFIHNECGHKYRATPDDFINGGTRCPLCFGNKRKTTSEFIDEVDSIFNGEYTVLSEYKNNKIPLTMRHNGECGHVFEVSPDAFLRGSHCNKCGTLKRAGENHYRYNPFLTEEERARRDMFNGELKKWRKKVFLRDNYTCNICKDVGGRLNAHHLYSWDVHKKERFDVDNGVTLCADCHKGFHSSFGYGKNTKEQFFEYKKSKTVLV